MNPKMVNKNRKPALIPAFSPGEKENRLPRLGKMTALDLRRFRGHARILSGKFRARELSQPP
jgi:hypothetical protein